MRTRTTFVGVDAHIDPYDARPIFTIRCRKPAVTPRADRGVRPYRAFYVVADGSCNFAIAPCRVDVGIDPYGDFAGMYRFTNNSQCKVLTLAGVGGTLRLALGDDEC